MACTPLNIDVGFFFTTNPWETTPTKSFDGKTVTLTPGGPSPGISVQKGAASLFHAKLANHNLMYGVLGNKFLVILDIEAGAGPSQRHISLVNFETMTEVPILTVLASSNAVALPVLNPSPGSGSVFLAFGQNGTEHTSVGIFRSDNGNVLCSLGSPIVPTGETKGEATATELIIHFSTGGTSKTQVCPRPLGKCKVSPSSQTFPDVFVGGCPFTPPTKQFSIKNVGTDCLMVNPISGVGPFSVQSTSKTLPFSLSPNEQVDVTIAFNPSTTGNFNPQNIPVSTAPANGDNQLACKAKALAAEFKIGFSSASINFGKHPVGEIHSKTLTITNTGSKPMTVSSSGVTSDGFSVPAFTFSLGCGDSQNVTVQFTAPSEGPHSAFLSVTHSAPGSPSTINLSGEGCIANAEIVVPPGAPISFGAIQQGFRMVKIFEVTNPGDGILSFEGNINGPDAALFGLPDPEGSVTNAPANRTYSVNPISPCGAISPGLGKTVVAISFFANATPPKTANATLTLRNNNATNVPIGQTWNFPLTAEITPPIALDIGLVIDRSDSMNQSLGSRVKLDAAISAGQLFVELLRADFDDRAAVVRFNNERNVVVPMTHIASTGSPTQDQIRQKVDTDIRPATGLTAIAGGAMMAIHEVETPRPTPVSPLNRAVVVLTDGIENTAFEEPPGTWLSIKGGTMYTPTATVTTDTVETSPVTWPDIDRYVVGLGKAGEVDPTQLEAFTGNPQRVMYVNQDLTGSLYFQLEKYYTQIFMNIVDTQSVLDPMYLISPGDKHEIEFDVLRGDVSALIVIFDFQGQRLPFFCISPKGEILDPVMIPPGFQLRSGFTSQARLVEFKMPMSEPERFEGRWKVVVEHRGLVCRGNPTKHSKEPGFLPRDCRDGVKDPLLYGIAIGVGSNFRMMPFVTPGPVYVGDPILLTAVVAEAGLPILGCTVTVEATLPDGTIRHLTLKDDGLHSDGDMEDGEYAQRFTQTFMSGIYHFTFRAAGFNRDGQPVVREAFRDKPVLLRRTDEPPGTGRPPGGRPGDGQRPPVEDCCQQLKGAIREQTELLKRLLRGKD